MALLHLPSPAVQVWFGDVNESDIKRGNLEDLLSYGFCYRTAEQMERMGLGHIPKQMASMVEEVWCVADETSRLE